jgi:hypothetical protein
VTISLGRRLWRRRRPRSSRRRPARTLSTNSVRQRVVSARSHAPARAQHPRDRVLHASHAGAHLHQLGACNVLLGTSPAATSSGHLDPNLAPTPLSTPRARLNHCRDSGQPCAFAGLYLRAAAGNSNPDHPPCFPSASPTLRRSEKKAEMQGFRKPTRGLEPRTPSLPWRCSTG